ncbi:MAG: hypothetical protein C0622_07945 [Desulfuromonas sp.]|nr:MAG: hypothetical protein C0622_07945 [Desulfuromonas sp.]
MRADRCRLSRHFFTLLLLLLVILSWSGPAGAALSLQRTTPTLSPTTTSSMPTVALPTDLAVVTGSVGVSKQTIKVGETLVIWANLQNLSTTTRNNVRVRFTCGTQLKDIHVNLIPRQPIRVETELIISAPTGVRPVKVEVNPLHNELPETNYTNNTQTSRVIVNAATLPTPLASPQSLAPATDLTPISPTTPTTPFPVLTGVSPKTLDKGRSYTLELQGNDLTTTMIPDFGQGIQLTGPLQASGGSTTPTAALLDISNSARNLILAPVRVDENATPGLRLINLRLGTESRLQRPTLTIRTTLSADVTHTPQPTEITRSMIPLTPDHPERPAAAATLTSMTPSRWKPGQKYSVTVIGDRLAGVEEISFGSGTRVDKLKHQGEKILTFTLNIDKNAQPGVRTALVGQNARLMQSQLRGWIISPPPQLSKVPELVWKPVEEVSLQQGAIYLVDPEWSYTGDVSSKHPVPRLNDETVFNWKEGTPGLADRFEIRFLTPRGTLIHSKSISLINPLIYTTSYKPDSAFLAELFEKYVAATMKNVQLQQTTPGTLSAKKTGTIGVINTGAAEPQSGGQSATITGMASGLSMIPPTFSVAEAENALDGLHQMSDLELYLRDNADQINLFWQVVGFKQVTIPPEVAADQSAPTSSVQQVGLQGSTPKFNATTTSSAAAIQATEMVEIEISEQWPLRMSDSWPTGVTCDATNQIDTLTPEWSHPGGVDPEDENHYPGDTLRLSGRFSIKNAPWAISAETTYTTSEYEPPEGQQQDGYVNATPIISDESYSFNNIIVDWGDGSWDRLQATAVESQLPGWSNADLMEFDQQHQYSYPAIFKIRFYVVPQDQMGQIEAIVNAHRAQPATDAMAARTKKQRPLMFAATNLSISDAAPGYAFSESGGVSAVADLELPGSRVFMLYCNPMTVTIVQDTAATGPLQLNSIEIVSFSSDAQPATTAPAVKADLSKTGSAGKGASAQTDKLPAQSGMLQVAPATGSPAQFSEAAQAQPNFHLENTTVSSCAGGLWARGQLRYVGQGYARIQWLVDGVVVGSKEIKVGPSELRKDLTLDPESWGEPLLSDIILDSPRLPISDLGLHRVQVNARVIADPTWSFVNAISLKSSVAAIQSSTATAGAKSATPALPLTSSGGLKPAFLPVTAATSSADIKLSAQSLQATLSESPGATLVQNLYLPPYSVIAPEKRYLVEEQAPGTLCKLAFPTQDGDFEIAGLSDVQQQSTTYSGKGLLIYKLPDGGPGSTSEHYVPIAFSDWLIPKGERVEQGRLDAAANETLDELPGMLATLTRLEGDAGDRLSAVLDVSIQDTTIRLVGAEEPQTWSGVSAPLTPAGDWYADNLSLGRSLIGWSMTAIESDDVRLDLSRSAGEAPAGQYGDAGWVGINLGRATLYPFLFDLDEIPLSVDGWCLTGAGLTGHAESSGFSHAFGDGAIGWDKLTINAYKSALNAKYNGFYVDLAWPKMRLEAEDAHYSYAPGSTVDVQLGMDNLPTSEQEYDVMTMKVLPKSFAHTEAGWGLTADAELSFRDQQGGLFADGITVNDLFFTIHSKVDYSGPSIPLNIAGQLGGATETITGLAISTGDEGSDNKIGFDFTTEFSLEGMPAATETVHILYGIDKYPTQDAFSTGPEHPAEIVLRFDFPDAADPLSSNELRINYLSGAVQTAGQGAQRVYAYNDCLPRVNDSGSGRLLLAGDVGVTGGGCGNDTFGGHVNTQMFGGQSKVIEGTFRFGETNGSKYWLTFFNGDNLHIPVYANIYIEMLRGGLAYNFAHDAFNHAGGFNACPSAGKGLLFSSGLGLSIGSENVIRADGVLTVHPADSFYELVGHAVLFNTADLYSRLRYHGSAFDGEIWGDVSLLGDQIAISAPEHSCGVHVDANEWRFYMGTKDQPVSGHLSDAVSGDTWLTLGNKTGFIIGAGSEHYYSRTAGGFGLSGTLTVDGEVTLALDPMRFSGKLGGRIEGKFVNPVKDVGLGANTHLSIGCCSPTSASFGFSVSCCCVKGGATVTVLPGAGFDPYAECTCCDPRDWF